MVSAGVLEGAEMLDNVGDHSGRLPPAWCVCPGHRNDRVARRCLRRCDANVRDASPKNPAADRILGPRIRACLGGAIRASRAIGPRESLVWERRRRRVWSCQSCRLCRRCKPVCASLVMLTGQTACHTSVIASSTVRMKSIWARVRSLIQFSSLCLSPVHN
jgi:hypothetical protein